MFLCRHELLDDLPRGTENTNSTICSESLFFTSIDLDTDVALYGIKFLSKQSGAYTNFSIHRECI